MPTPQKKNYTKRGKTQGSKHWASVENMSKAMKLLFQNKNVTDMSSQTQMARKSCHRHARIRLRESTAAQVTKPQQRQLNQLPLNQRLSLQKKVLPIKKDLKCFETNENIFEFYLLNYYSEKSSKKSDRICCQMCRTW
jgi:hypothetical protein